MGTVTLSAHTGLPVGHQLALNNVGAGPGLTHGCAMPSVGDGCATSEKQGRGTKHEEHTLCIRRKRALLVLLFLEQFIITSLLLP